MEPHGPESKSDEHETVETFLQKGLLPDLEVSPQGKILKLGAGLGESTLARSGGAIDVTLAELDKLARNAKYLLGHNLVRHDLPVLREWAANLQVFQLPVVDTLVPSPIWFPETAI